MDNISTNVDTRNNLQELYCFNRINGSNELNDAHSSISSTLYKYTKHSKMNYHLETDVDWDVCCPVCDKSARDLPKRNIYY